MNRLNTAHERSVHDLKDQATKDMPKSSFDLFYSATFRLLSIYLLGIILLMSFRTALLVSFGNFPELSDYKLDLLNAYWTGFRFDTSVMAYGLSFIFILNLLVLLLDNKAQSNTSAIKKFTFWYVLFIFFAFILILFADHFYYMFFQSHFNKLLFGIAEGEPMAVLKSVWTDYPLVPVLIITATITLILAWFLKKILAKEHIAGIKGRFSEILFVLSISGLYLLALRGSLGPVPICRDVDTYISTNLFLNDLTINGVFSLKEAFSERSKSQFNSEISSHGQKGFSALHRVPVIDAPAQSQLLFDKTPSSSFLKQNPPHVIFVLMESMSNYYLDLHSQELNLLGSLEKQLPYCILFRNFLSDGNGTIQSLESLMINNPHVSMAEAQTTYINKPLSSSVALPFLKAGYHTSFITGDGLRLFNLDKFVSKQYFQAVEGSAALLSKTKNASAGTWGVFDEFLFDRVFSTLENSGGKPQFVFAMSTSNHTPFDLPATYKPYPVQIPPDMLKKINTSKDIAVKNFTAYQYANDCLGRFLEKLRHSPFAENTIVVATGDHNILQLFSFSYTQLLQKRSVPLIFYVPQKYRPSTVVNTARFASHKDVFPTIFHLSLPDASYLKTGNNLFDNSLPEEVFFALNDSNLAMNKEGCILMQDRPYYYQWQKKYGSLLEPTSPVKTPALKGLLEEVQTYAEQMDYIMTKIKR